MRRSAISRKELSDAVRLLIHLMPSVHFVAHHPAEDAVSRYRCLNFMEQLGARGWQTGFSCIQEPGAVEIDAEVIVLNRVLSNANVRRFARSAKESGRILVSGFDDLVFDSAWTEKEVEEAPPLQRAQVRAEVEGYRAALKETLDLCDCSLVSTDFLAAKAGQAGKKAFVLRNTMPSDLWQLSQKAREEYGAIPKRGFRLGYFSGTRTHNRDFASIAGALSRAFATHKNLTLLLVGPIVVPQELEDFRSRIEQAPVVGWRELPALIRKIDLNLAPLDLMFEFNQGKSHLKWLEAAAVGVPTIASDTAEFRASMEQGANGWLARTEEDWIAGIDSAVADGKRVGEAARSMVERRFLGSIQAAETLAVFEEIREAYGSAGALGPPLVLNRLVAAERIARKLKSGVAKAARGLGKTR